MRARDEIRLIISGIFLIQVVLAFGSMGLLARMAPAIEGIIADNVVSIEAVEDMLAVLAAEPAPDTLDARRTTFNTAFDQARNNVTEEEEKPELLTIEAHRDAALQGVSTDRAQTVAALQRLGDVNVRSMRATDLAAKRLGTAGAWAAMMLGALGFVFAVLAVRRLTRRVIQPLDELANTVEAYRAGDLHRRFHAADAPTELTRVGETINALIQDQLVPREETHHPWEADRAAVLHFLDASPLPTALVSTSGDILATNRLASDLLRSVQGPPLRDELQRYLADPTPEHPTMTLTPLRGAAFLFTFKAPEGDN